MILFLSMKRDGSRRRFKRERVVVRARASS
jgi:hypothetical protein